MNIALAIKQLRMEAHLSQKQFAEKCKIGKTYLSEVESGARVPKITSIDKIAKGLDIPVSEIMKKAESLDQKEEK